MSKSERLNGRRVRTTHRPPFGKRKGEERAVTVNGSIRRDLPVNSEETVLAGQGREGPVQQ